jgi:hypothetical protein
MIERSQRSEGTTELHFHIRLSKRWLLGVTVLVVLTLIGALALFRGGLAQSNPDPFSPTILAATKFPLYYPESLPSGFRVDEHSVTTPKAGVVMFNLVSSSGSRIWLSEEARPSTFNLGGFYDNLQHLHEFGVSDGAVAFGYDGLTEIASRANATTWLLSNTNAKVPESQMVNMLKSVVPAH